jgi:K+-sensing histidine kinase KdpD
VLSRAIEGATEFAQSRHVILASAPADLDFVVGDGDLLVRAFHALIETAVKFSAQGEIVRLSCSVVADSIEITIESHGRTIPGPDVARFFDLFSIGEQSRPAGAWD